MREWLSCRKVAVEEIDGAHDLQAARLFPVCSTIEELGLVMRWMISEPELQEGKEIWKRSRRLSADEISAYANLRRLAAQRDSFRVMNWPVLARNYERSVFYQLNLDDAAHEFAIHHLELPDALPLSAPLMTRIRDNMFRDRKSVV